MLKIIIQGILEAFPISSSMHCDLFKVQNVEIMHFGTFLAFFFFSFNQLKEYIFNPFNKKTIQFGMKNFLLILPTFCLGFYLKNRTQFLNPSIINIFFALIMLYANLKNEKRYFNELKIFELLIISLIISLALIPGCSRLGVTFSAFRFFKINKKESLIYSIILGIPITLGASLFALLKQEFSLFLICESIIAGILTYFSLFITEKSLNYWNYYVIYRIIFSLFYFVLC